jgi:hypothetical protein
VTTGDVNHTKNNRLTVFATDLRLKMERSFRKVLSLFCPNDHFEEVFGISHYQNVASGDGLRRDEEIDMELSGFTLILELCGEWRGLYESQRKKHSLPNFSSFSFAGG